MNGSFRLDALKSSPRIVLCTLFSLVFLLGFFSHESHSAQVRLSWAPSESPGVAGYKVYYGEHSGSYREEIDVGRSSSCLVSGLEEGKTYHFSVVAYDSVRQESEFSLEIFYPGLNIAPQAQMISGEGGDFTTLCWSDLHEIDRIVLRGSPGPREEPLTGVLHFSDGTTLNVGPLLADGAQTPVTFPPKVVNQVTLVLENAKGNVTGISEIQIFANPAY